MKGAKTEQKREMELENEGEIRKMSAFLWAVSRGKVFRAQNQNNIEIKIFEIKSWYFLQTLCQMKVWIESISQEISFPFKWQPR